VLGGLEPSRPVAAATCPPLQAPGYNCPKACTKAPNCHCASHDIPGGLAPADTPQFVVLVSTAAAGTCHKRVASWKQRGSTAEKLGLQCGLQEAGNCNSPFTGPLAF
jgi:hypothetical protein